jgi:uncharacterized membrane protein
MGSRAPLTLSFVLISVMALMSTIAWPWVPASHVAIHFDIHNRANGFASRTFALLIAPIAAVIVTGFYLALSFLPGSKCNNSWLLTKAHVVGWIGTLIILGVAHALVILKAIGVNVDVVGNAILIASLFLIVFGNYLGKLPPNDYAGIRTPWTLASYLSWEKTNRLGGWIIVGSGLATLGVLEFLNAKVASAVLFVALSGGFFVLFPVSWYFWKRDPDKR